MTGGGDMPGIADLEERLGHRFADKDLLERALTHRSVAGSAADGRNPSYERLEFLGDRILGFVIADMLMQHYASEPEGDLSKRLNALVRRETLADVAREIGLGPHIRLGGADDTARDNPAILSDVCEALIAALYRDAGIDAARVFIERCWTDRLGQETAPPRDAKSMLQEWTMGRGEGLPKYEVVDQSGPDHAPVFVVEVRIPGQPAQRAEGRTKRAAEQEAAARMLESVTDVV